MMLAPIGPNALSGAGAPPHSLAAPTPVKIHARTHGSPPSTAPLRAAASMQHSAAEQHARMALAGVHAMPDHDLHRRAAHSLRSQQVVAGLIAHPNLSFSGVTQALLHAAGEGAMTHGHALALTAQMPRDVPGLRAFLAYLGQAAAHSHALLSAEQARRGGRG